jgi:hypothetical protein
MYGSSQGGKRDKDLHTMLMKRVRGTKIFLRFRNSGLCIKIMHTTIF